VTTTEVCGVKYDAMRWSRVAHAAIEAQTATTRGFLAVSAGDLEIAIGNQGALEVF